MTTKQDETLIELIKKLEEKNNSLRMKSPNDEYDEQFVDGQRCEIQSVLKELKVISALEGLEHKPKDAPQGTYVNSRYYREHKNETKEGIKIELGECYVTLGGHIVQILSTEVLGDFNILAQGGPDNKLIPMLNGRSHYGMLEEDEYAIIAHAKDLNNMIESRKKEVRKECTELMIAVWKENNLK